MLTARGSGYCLLQLHVLGKEVYMNQWMEQRIRLTPCVHAWVLERFTLRATPLIVIAYMQEFPQVLNKLGLKLRHILYNMHGQNKIWKNPMLIPPKSTTITQ